MIIEPPTKIECKETTECDGTLNRFLLAQQTDDITAQYQCNKCRMYVRYVNGDWFSVGKYNNIMSYLILMIITEMNSGQILSLKEDKKFNYFFF